MALIKCPECGKEISDKSKVCINCGYPLDTSENFEVNKADENNEINVDNKTNETQEEITQNTPAVKCCNCGSDLEISYNQVGHSPKNFPIMHRFGYCSNCKHSFDLDEKPTQQLPEYTQPISTKKYDSALSVCAIIFSLFGITGIVAVILALIDIGINDKKKRHIGSWAAIFISCAYLVFFLEVCSPSDKTSNKKDNVISSESSTKTNEKTTTANKNEDTEQETMLSRDKDTYNNDITYDMLARNPEKYYNSPVKFTGTITQILGADDGYIQVRMNVDDNSDYNLMFTYEDELIDYNLLERDNVTIYGGFVKLIDYESVLGNSITVPYVHAVMIDYNEKSETIDVTIELPELPLTVNEYGWDGSIDSTVTFTDIEVSIEKNWNDAYYADLKISGEKTFGDNSYTYVAYKLYDSDGYIVDSGNFSTEKISAGDKFKNLEQTLYDLQPGAYKLEISEYK